jgi:hypothetical protein
MSNDVNDEGYNEAEETAAPPIDDGQPYWETWSEEDVERAEADADADGGEFLALKEGANVVRFLPALRGGKKYVKILQHFVPAFGQRKAFSAPCTMPTTGVCALCAHASQLAASHAPAERELAEKMKPKARYFYNVVRRGRGGVLTAKVLAAGPGIHSALGRIQADKSTGGDFTDPTANGFDIVIDKQGSGLNTEYDVRPARGMSALHPDPQVVRGLITGQPDLSKFERPMTPELLLEKLGLNALPVSADLSVPMRGGAPRALPERTQPRRAGDDMEGWKPPARR